MSPRLPDARRCDSARCAAVALLAIGLVACAAKRPVLYPNAHYRQVGEAEARREVDECIAFAKAHASEADAAGRVAARTTGGAAAGGAAGAAAGAVFGNAGRGAAAGAAAGGARSLLRGLFARRDPDPIERAFAQECLRERGYRVIGWD